MCKTPHLRGERKQSVPCTDKASGTTGSPAPGQKREGPVAGNALRLYSGSYGCFHLRQYFRQHPAKLLYRCAPAGSAVPQPVAAGVHRAHRGGKPSGRAADRAHPRHGGQGKAVAAAFGVYLLLCQRAHVHRAISGRRTHGVDRCGVQPVLLVCIPHLQHSQQHHDLSVHPGQPSARVAGLHQQHGGSGRDGHLQHGVPHAGVLFPPGKYPPLVFHHAGCGGVHRAYHLLAVRLYPGACHRGTPHSGRPVRAGR